MNSMQNFFGGHFAAQNIREIHFMCTRRFNESLTNNIVKITALNNKIQFIICLQKAFNKMFNPTALRTAKTLWNSGCSEYNRVKSQFLNWILLVYF